MRKGLSTLKKSATFGRPFEKITVIVSGVYDKVGNAHAAPAISGTSEGEVGGGTDGCSFLCWRLKLVNVEHGLGLRA